MHRADDLTADPTANGPGKAGYTAGQPGVTAATVVAATALNSIQEEIALSVEGDGIALSTADNGQLARVLKSRSTHGAREAMAIAAYDSTALVTGFATSPRAFASNGGGRVVAVGTGGMVQKNNGAGLRSSSWSSSALGSSSTKDMWCATCVPSLPLFIAAGDQEVHSSSNGVTWTRLFSLASGIIFRDIATDGASKYCALAGASSGAVASFWDGGAHQSYSLAWTTGQPRLCWDATNNRFVAIDFGGTVRRSADGDNTWVSLGSSGLTQPQALVTLPDSGWLMAIGLVGGVLRARISKDGGATWATGLASPTFGNSSGQIYAAMRTNHAVFVSSFGNASNACFYTHNGDAWFTAPYPVPSGQTGAFLQNNEFAAFYFATTDGIIRSAELPAR